MTEADARVLSPVWVTWIAGRLLAGEAPDVVVPTLVQAGVPLDRAVREVADIAASPVLAAAAVPAAVSRLRTARLAHARVDVRPGLDVDTLLHVYVANTLPVLVPDWCASWPAGARWADPQRFVELAGTALVDVVVDGGAPDRDRTFVAYTQRMTLAEYVARVEAAPAGNGLYMLANHRNLCGPLAALLDDIAPPDGLMTPRWRTAEGASLWYGPAGTHTPAHHDTSSVVFCQVRGRKTIWLAPPDDQRIAKGQRGFYTDVVLSAPGATAPGGALAGGCVHRVELGPGDMLLIPAGWWHEVLATETSVSVGLVGLSVRNAFDAFRIGGA